MSDNPSKTDGRDRSKVSGSEDYEVEHFARHMGLTNDQVRELIKEHGNDRATLEREAVKLKGG